MKQQREITLPFQCAHFVLFILAATCREGGPSKRSVPILYFAQILLAFLDARAQKPVVQ